MQIGPIHIGDGKWRFTLWAPRARSVDLLLGAGPGAPERSLPMECAGRGYWIGDTEHAHPGTRYRFRLTYPDGSTVERADPASHLQLEDVHGPSTVVDHDAHTWRHDQFAPPLLAETVIYELHTGAFTEEGTFDAAAEKLDHLVDLGVNAVEIMPVAQFPGPRNWGYDGVYPFAVHPAYGGPGGLRRFVDACHGKHIAVILDVVYNHLGPEGNYLRDFGPYFTNAYTTPWGEAVNFDGPGSDGVRNYFVQNAIHWLDRYRIDGLRLDATHAIFDYRPTHILGELSKAVADLAAHRGRRFWLMAESDLNDPRLVRPRKGSGLGMDAVWCDDFHHAVHALLTDERDGYYMDYGRAKDVARAMENGFVYTGQYSPFRGHGHGAPCPDIAPERFITCIQNHDQVGNRMLGERLARLVDFETLKCAAAMLLLAPQTPLLFMGEEYGEDNPFLYFISHLDGDLVQAVRNGRKEEFAHFMAHGEPPDPQSEATFADSTLNWPKATSKRGQELFAWYKALIALRRELPAAAPGETRAALLDRGGLLRLERGSALVAFYNLNDNEPYQELEPHMPPGGWRIALDSSDPRFTGAAEAAPDLQPKGVRIYTKDTPR
ncbi:malto-oligosyltrehalose trehalohydrolase [Oceanidesulfovibrio marinus]|uniref:Malto-oligosyltrehalose trehalohydrolase n=1 Tax=Oceanidesulfovibrio marinus TaxID=370038 RepID=A0A6P1ZES5_9BACT|nr:malto-oligosyltrehalose trehalohydrolase [Oceanidesulfovibrio marinus]TVM32827.1 malto-oligosyltrehalose trehalohydrolase [Oceanidesulfovibrio marinus]